MTNNNEKIYWDSIHYGKIVSSEDFDFKSDGVFITMKVIILDGVKRLFYLRNGEVVKVETIKN